eukprot:507389-Prorocentrum_minimum.AAC.1
MWTAEVELAYSRDAHHALIVEGAVLRIALERDEHTGRAPLEQEFMALALACQSVVCCRVSPLQKAQYAARPPKRLLYGPAEPG